MLVDFHSHSFESDGTLSPTDLFAAMTARGVEAFSVTDHDSLGAYTALSEFADARLVTGIELNTTYRGGEVHILGYGFPTDAPEIGDVLAEHRRRREERVRETVARLVRLGYDLSLEEVRAEAAHPGTALGRPHVARALVRNGYCRDIEGAFRDLLGAGKPAYVPIRYLGPQEAIGLVARVGGVAVLAHPGRLADDAIVEELVEAGLAGIEVFYPLHDPAAVARFRELAARYGLVMTAGSDFHDLRWNARGVGMDVERDDIAPFLELVGG
ncbi:MAG: PHP domain-containing protein [Vulcanimicrobiaceae bacterium]